MTVTEAALVESLETGLRIALGPLTGDAAKLVEWRECAHDTLTRRGWTLQQVDAFIEAVERHHRVQQQLVEALGRAQQEVRDAWRHRRDEAHDDLLRARARSLGSDRRLNVA